MTPSPMTYAAIRFGYGLSPDIPSPASAAEILGQLQLPDQMAERYPIAHFPERAEQERRLGELRRAKRQDEDGAAAAFKAANTEALKRSARDMRMSMLRPVLSPDGFRERLVRFWADHFAIAAKGKGLRDITTAYVEDAIRPNITASFRDLLRAAETHPVMLIYLDQILSVGPNSKAGQKSNRGLNENLAREILELHTLGVGGTYSQTDVREFAELLTGIFYNFRTGFAYREHTAEPGAETVLGKTYGGKVGRLEDIYAVLDDLAVHPDTARHIAGKLAVHFVADQPDPGMVDAMTAAFRDTGGELVSVYAAMLEHPAAWQNFGQKAKQPFDFLTSSMRAMGVGADQLENLPLRKSRIYLAAPMRMMGQPWQQPAGPNGWPEETRNWITPQGLAARIEWALMAAGLFESRLDPPEFARVALGDMAGDELLMLSSRAESRLEGMALVLSSPEFNRR
ncbi:MAG: DUF1800 domain-containing protein [Rhodobacteraceae bacterium]|nr:DUF1800 domain-containing protein [Paracoccaceae bacterium]